MGVKGLWELLAPVGRPVMLETAEGKSMAIDSSIWIYQFQATMRDKEGRGLINAHVLGFLRRITKLMFYGIKPVFVFDGGAPALKRATLNERRRKKAGAAESHAKVAQQLLAAQLRKKAVEEAQLRQSGKGKDRADVAVIDDDAVYLEDLDSDMARSPEKSPTKPSTSTPAAPSPTKVPFRDHDLYRLPELDLTAAIAKAANSARPDARLATEDELRSFIEDMRPEDFDVSSAEFQALPTEVQFEVIADLRVRSRQTSYKRLQQMLRNAPTALDFSREQIKGLQQRNSLTQQLLETSGMVSKDEISITVRIASERNKQYVLTKNEGPGGGWVLGRISDEGTSKAKAIRVDGSSDHEVEEVAPGDDDSDDMDMEEVEIPLPVPMDPDLREFQRENALEAIASRRAKLDRTQKARPPPAKQLQARPLFVPDNDDDDDDDLLPVLPTADTPGDDEELQRVLDESRDDAETADLRTAIEHSKADIAKSSSSHGLGESSKGASTSHASSSRMVLEEDDDEDLYASPIRLHTALAIAGTAPPSARKVSDPFIKPSHSRLTPRPRPRPSFGLVSSHANATNTTPTNSIFPPPRIRSASGTQPPADEEELFGTPKLLLLDDPAPVPAKSHAALLEHPRPLPTKAPASVADIPPRTPAQTLAHQAASSAPAEHDKAPLSAPLAQASSSSVARNLPAAEPTRGAGDTEHPTEDAVVAASHSDDEDMEEVGAPQLSLAVPPSMLPDYMNERDSQAPEDGFELTTVSPAVPIPSTASVEPLIADPSPAQTPFSISVPTLASAPHPIDDDDEEGFSGWSRSPSPTTAELPRSATPRPDAPQQDWDAAQEMDAQAEEGEFARFAAQVKGKDLRAVQVEIEDEIRVLHAQRKAALRDSEDVTTQMVSQIMVMLRLFGIPYMTAPMEAEAQCAELVALGLVDGVITDDSDVFLFGGARVFKNMFNQSKTVECFLAADLARELGLTRDTLIRLACLLGSDYIDGLPGVGPVVAMELLKEFPGEDGLHKFKDWWLRVQTGKDRPEESKSKFRKRFKKRFREKLYLADDWPNPTVRDAYYHPTVDNSEEPFKWGLPDLDGLRGFLKAELGWNEGKVDELLLPIIQKTSKRNQATALNKQGNLNDFFDVSSGSGTAAPRKRQAYASKRLQQVVTDFREQQARLASGSGDDADGDDSAAIEEAQPATKKRKRAAKPKADAVPKAKKAARGRGRGRGRGSSARGGKRRAAAASDEESLPKEGSGDEDEFVPPAASAVQPAEAQSRPRPKPRPRPARKAAATIEANDEHGAEQNDEA